LSRLSQVENIRQKLLLSETGSIVKEGFFPLEVGLTALSPYELAMDSLGFQTVYRLFNEHPGVRCERIFCLDRENPADEKSWISLESGRKLSQFSVLAVSLSYEKDCLILPELLEAAGLPFYSGKRGDDYPLVFCGGPVITANPEPVAPFVDVCGIGDGEVLVPAFIEACLESLQRRLSRQELLLALAARGGFYVPAFYEPELSGASPLLVPVPKVKGAPERLARAVHSLDGTPAHSVIVSRATHFRSMFLVEIARGCGWGCRFCLVSRINRPYRPVKADRVFEVLEKALPGTRAVGLVGANLCDHPQLETILEWLVGNGFQLGVSSLRLDTVSERLLSLIRECRVKNVTLAPETASVELLAATGKNYEPRQLLDAVKLVAGRRFESLKLYYMIGLPDEYESDRMALAEQVNEISDLIPAGMGLKVSVNPFIPKPQSAWQDEPMLEPLLIRKSLRMIRRKIRSGSGGKVDFQAGTVAEALTQAVISVGDRKVARALELAAGGKRRFLDCLNPAGIEIESLLHQRGGQVRPHPWRILEEG
jgi:radical SAM superfamily enzyme YgiQ (UPF0313 family)